MKVDNNVTFTYYCKKCNYGTNRKNDYEKHKLTDKHMRLNCSDSCENNTVHKCKICNKEYKHLRSLYRHERNCKVKNLSILEKQLQLVNNEQSLHDKINQN